MPEHVSGISAVRRRMCSNHLRSYYLLPATCYCDRRESFRATSAPSELGDRNLPFIIVDSLLFYLASSTKFDRLFLTS